MSKKRTPTYVRIGYSKKRDAFRIDYTDNGGTDWEFGYEFRCLKYDGQEDGEPEMIHYSALKVLLRWFECGYELYTNRVVDVD